MAALPPTPPHPHPTPPHPTPAPHAPLTHLRLGQPPQLLRLGGQRVALARDPSELLELCLQLAHPLAKALLRLHARPRQPLGRLLAAQRLRRLPIAGLRRIAQLLELQPQLARAALALGGHGLRGRLGALVGRLLALPRLAQRLLQSGGELSPARRLRVDCMLGQALEVVGGVDDLHGLRLAEPLAQGPPLLAQLVDGRLQRLDALALAQQALHQRLVLRL